MFLKVSYIFAGKILKSPVQKFVGVRLFNIFKVFPHMFTKNAFICGGKKYICDIYNN